MKFLLAGIFFIGSLFLSFSMGRDFELSIIGIATILGFVLGKVFELQKDLTSLRESLADDWASRQTKSNDVENKEENEAEVNIANHWVNSSEDLSTQEASSPAVDNQSIPSNKVAEKTLSMQAKEHIPIEKEISLPNEDTLFEKGLFYVKDYFSGGNLFVRVGIIILFFGVSFLLKYVSDRGMFPIEYRLIGVVVGAIALLGLGWRLRLKNETYALLLQGAGIGVLYLDIYAAFSLYQLIPPLAAFALLFIVSMFSAALSVLQDSKSLAVLGFSGGFLAPVLASSGSNNHVGLFSYYAVLNLAIVVVAWFKAWRSLNILGFAFTFIIGTAWGVFSYNDTKFATTEPFLIMFFLFYVLIAVLFSLRQPPKLRGYVDGTLLFGVPLAASALQYSLISHLEYGVSLSSFAIGAFYLGLSWFVWTRKGKDLKLLAEAFLALGVIYASMAIPFALAPTQTAAAWALEGAGLLWLGSRQNRLSVRLFGVILQGSAGIIFLARNSYQMSQNIFVNAEFISSMMMAAAGILSARLLIKAFNGRKLWEKNSSPILLVWGLLWLFGGFIFTMVEHLQIQWLPTSLLIFSAIVSLGFTLAAQRLKPEWKHAWIAASAIFGMVVLIALVQFSLESYEKPYHPFMFKGWLAWPIIFVVYYTLLRKLEQHRALLSFQPILHSTLLILLVGLVTFEGSFIIKKWLPFSSDWLAVWYAIPTVITLWLIIKPKFWPVIQHRETYQNKISIMLVAYLVLWLFIALISQGRTDPLPWMPLLNPLDIALVIILMTLFKWWKTVGDDLSIANNQCKENKLLNQRSLIIGFAGLVFIWLNFTLFRVAHHWFSIPYNSNALFDSGLVQTAVSILWALSGVILTVYASRKQIRFLWVTGAVILGLVVLKLFIIDLSALGSISRIVSFLVVGGLLTSIGYFAPLPESVELEEKKEENSDV